MDCDHNKRSDTGWRRPQRPTPPGMNTDCCCNSDMQIPMRPAVRPQMQQPGGVLPMQSDIPRQMIGMPIGMGYVPWQRWGQTYPLSQGFQRGTIFPELDLPFVMGRCRG